ncbi:hypothetical protein SOM11_10840 [Frigoribacterium sp. CFBP9039]|uniref:hypothetical protein n=1 Tax=Frigoribacterium TaxID=96492 RepID=UPI00177FA881|nr:MULTISPECIES: hypothetical protein [Frigoribacterium]MBD8703258.1 hypothetical protein [Frigoribacterium sp. CFBP 13712]MCJ0701877.1 hypothetical protein [Frigoribacterium faeni]MDY0890695.1 hypothetical protein [Frigoribacterium sp. CFBP9030]MDY0946478.1 hypothetical protein [Frigoribacterium sp. CFBP9039]
MNRSALHRLLVAVVVVLLVAAAALYVLSVTLAPGGRDVAGLFVGYAWGAVVLAVLVGVVDFFVRSSGSRSHRGER